MSFRYLNKKTPLLDSAILDNEGFFGIITPNQFTVSRPWYMRIKFDLNIYHIVYPFVVCDVQKMAGKKQTKQKQPESRLLSKYLFVYNLVQLVGWSYIFCLVVQFYLTSQYKHEKLWAYVFKSIAVFQTAAVLEIVHVILGFVKTSIMVTSLQILFRLLNTFLVFNFIPPDVDTIGVLMTLIAWCGAEITRYTFHIFKELNFVPYFITWLRYTAFIVLIPLGVSGELLGQYVVQSLYANLWKFKLPFINLYVGYRHLIILMMLSTAQGIITISRHMFQQRRKALGTKPAKVKLGRHRF